MSNERAKFEEQAERFYAEAFGAAWDSNKSVIIGALMVFGQASRVAALAECEKIAAQEQAAWRKATSGHSASRSIAEAIQKMRATP